MVEHLLRVLREQQQFALDDPNINWTNACTDSWILHLLPAETLTTAESDVKTELRLRTEKCSPLNVPHFLTERLVKIKAVLCSCSCIVLHIVCCIVCLCVFVDPTIYYETPALMPPPQQAAHGRL